MLCLALLFGAADGPGAAGSAGYAGGRGAGLAGGTGHCKRRGGGKTGRCDRMGRGDAGAVRVESGELRVESWGNGSFDSPSTLLRVAQDDTRCRCAVGPSGTPVPTGGGGAGEPSDTFCRFAVGTLGTAFPTVRILHFALCIMHLGGLAYGL